ncbi:unnamed protein product [Parascedosporium putredinis]|uniref:Frequency clock protein n=1 Tax=Parascedosporium putredinis TaxID=1442378 RepID=A0A9P1MEK0_9PEZI|nr:unnamed protein product [Parascedosporium putredinis]CAI8004772.1 unnamed protein product [Parascedosporium putredinis]
MDASRSSSAGDYRSVIDDLTIEIQRLKDELKKYKHSGPSPLKSEKLFELKIHGLPAWKKRELEVTLREFTSNLEVSNTNETSSARKKSSRSSRRSGSKQPSSSSESYLRPVDSAYASMSTGHTSAGTSGRHSSRSRPKYSEQKVENYLKEIPSGLYPRHISMSEKQKKKLVRRWDGIQLVATHNSTPEQRPTRPRDLDPDRAQNPSENIEYLRHLGIAPPDIQHTEVGLDKEASLSPDAEGWVYLNLLYNLAQLHIYNVTLSFTRAAVSEKSSMFQMSADGCKIRWRGGTEGTSPTNLSSNDRRIGGEDGVASRGPKSKLSEGKTSSDPSAARRSRFGAHSPQTAADSFQYKPLFVKNRSPNEQTSEDTGSSRGSRDESYFTGSPWAGSGSGSSLRRKRRVDGAIIYYSGAPFCTDLAGDPGTTLSSPLCEDPIAEEYLEEAPIPHRTLSGSSLAYRPFSISRQDLLESRPADASSDLGMDMLDGENDLGESVEDVTLSQFSPEARLNMVMERVSQLRASQERGYHIRTPCTAPRLQASAPGFEYVGGHIKGSSRPPFRRRLYNEQLAASEAASRRVHPHDSDISLDDTGVESSDSDEAGSAVEGPSSNSNAMLLDDGSGTTSPPETIEALQGLSARGASLRGQVIQGPTNEPRGIPYAPFVDRVEDYKIPVYGDEPPKAGEWAERKDSRDTKTLDTVQFLQLRKDDDEPIETTFELNDTLYTKAQIPPTEEVFIWLGANVMLSYPIDEAHELLQGKLSTATQTLQNCEEDMDF